MKSHNDSAAWLQSAEAQEIAARALLRYRQRLHGRTGGGEWQDCLDDAIAMLTALHTRAPVG